MKYLALGATLVALLAAGCGNTAHIAATPQAKQAEAVVRGCINKSSKKAIETCIAPPGHTAQLRSCAVSAAVHDFYSQPKLVAALTKCVVKFR